MKHNVVQMFVNCMSVSDPKHIYSRIVAKATGEEDVTQNEAADEFERLIFPTKKAKKETIL